MVWFSQTTLPPSTRNVWMVGMKILAQVGPCFYRNSLTQRTLACLLEWGKKDVSMCLTGIIWASSTDIQATSNAVATKKHEPMRIKSCRSSLHTQLAALSEARAIGPGLL